MESYEQAYCRNRFLGEDRCVEEKAQKNREMNEQIDIPDDGLYLRKMSALDTEVAALNKISLDNGDNHFVESTVEETLFDLGFSLDGGKFNE